MSLKPKMNTFPIQNLKNQNTTLIDYIKKSFILKLICSILNLKS